MRGSIKFEDREQLFESVIDDLKLKKIDECYYPEIFGNFFTTFSAKDFLIKYVSDRSELSIQIASESEPSKWFDLSFIKNLILRKEKLNSDNGDLNFEGIKKLNDFLKNNYEVINDLFNPKNYKITTAKIETLLESEFKSNHPWIIE